MAEYALKEAGYPTTARLMLAVGERIARLYRNSPRLLEFTLSSSGKIEKGVCTGFKELDDAGYELEISGYLVDAKGKRKSDFVAMIDYKEKTGSISY